ncbi:MAG: hypothetical protein WCV90_01405 [Candidatus Woesearchaeota archaeon]|jgi:hypothetical protein
MLDWKKDIGDYLRLDDQIVNPNSGVEGIPVVFNIEILHEYQRRNPLHLSVYHSDISYHKITVSEQQDYPIVFRTKKGLYVPDQQRSWAYFFDCRTGTLKGYDYCNGDFTDSDFSWSEDRILRKDSTITSMGKPYKNASKVVPLITSRIEQLVFESRDLHQTDLYKGFLFALRKIKMNETRKG